MIIFYNKFTGEIQGYINGRKHYKGEENFWVGDRKIVKRILYDSTAPYFEEALADPLMARKFKVNLSSLKLELKQLD